MNFCSPYFNYNRFGLGSISNANISNINSDNSDDLSFVSINLQSSFAILNANIHIDSSYVEINISNGYFTFYNSSMTCNSQSIINCSITCNNNEDSNNIEFLILDATCEDICIVDSQCNILNDIDYVLQHVDNASSVLVADILSITTEFDDKYETDCNTLNNSMVFDIGFSYYSDKEIANTINQGIICCRGYESCAYSNSITTDLGSILCLGDSACTESQFIYTGDHLSATDHDNNVYIYCMGYSACYKSSLRSANDIVCSGYHACENSLIVNSEKVYCLKRSCTNAIMADIDVIYIIDSQNGFDVFSGDKSQVSIYFRGPGAGAYAALKCEQGSVCYIDCGIGSCDNITTTITCGGKCKVACNGIPDNSECVNIVSSLAPSSAPSNAPSTAPTTPPTRSDALTDEDVSMWFNWTLACVVTIICLVIIIAQIDSKKMRQNDLYRWSSLVVFGIYTIDFISGMYSTQF